MALAQHSSVDVRFKQQVENSQDYLIPFIEEVLPLEKGMRVMEIGCGEGGVLRAFLDRGTSCLGVDLSVPRIERAKAFFEEDIKQGNIDFRAKNVYDDDFLEENRASFDLILLKDTIEHIPEQEKFIPYITQFLKPNRFIFFGFPPWRMPFGGHQQTCKSKVLGMTPYFHLLPMPLYKGVLKTFGETDANVRALEEIKETGISLARFERIIKHNHLEIASKRLYLINPIYRFKFGLKPRIQSKFVGSIPYFKDFFTTAGWYIIKAS
ncbi:MAG: class I SAM-dependent methyltransferase [Bacteroidia bacterium]|nr:class I SAM-dependent methyltransferase [Bacteroidia bacterium]